MDEQQLFGLIEKSVDAAVSKSVAKATASLNESASVVDSANKLLTVKFVAAVLVGLLVVCLAAFAFASYQVSDLQRQRDSLQLQIEQMQSSIADLHEAGGDIRFNTCDGHLCVRVDAGQEYGNGFYVIHGY